MQDRSGGADDGNGSGAEAPVEGLRAYLSHDAVRGRTTDDVTTAMREAILDGYLPPSTWLRESELAEAFHVSRTPVREALRRLADEGLAVKTAHHGAMVASLSLEDVLALYVVREDLEGLAARLAAVRCPPGLVDELDEINASMRDAAAREDIAGLSTLNLTWHRALRTGAANPYLERFLNQVEHAVRRLPKTTLIHPGRSDEVLAEHDAIARAVQARDGAAAEREARAHMRRAREIRLAVLLGD
jgi:DNA-binding GntR family transcriptional regulator